jgi:hypothetical protein
LKFAGQYFLSPSVILQALIVSLCVMKSPEKEATDETVGAGVPAVAAARGTQEGQGTAPLHRAFQEAGPTGGRGG